MKTLDFPSVSALLDATPSPANRALADAHLKSVAGGRRAEWYGVANIDAAKTTLLGGWAEGAARSRDALGSLEVPRVSSVRRRPTWSDQGDEVDPSRVLSGELDTAWRTSRREPRAGGQTSAARIVIVISTPCTYRAETFFWRGALACRLADALEESGRSVEIVATNFIDGLYTRADGPTLTSVTLKGEGEPLDLARLAAMTAHPAALRVAFFRGDFAYSDAVSSTHGFVSRRDYPQVAAEEAITFVIRNVYTREAAQEFIEAASLRLEQD